jgi:voltage-dependent anion channel protein 2
LYLVAVDRVRSQDLGKSSNDLLSKDYPFSSYSLEVKTRAPSDVAFKVAGNRSSSSATAPIYGDLEAKWSDRKHGLVFTQTWTSANVLKTQFELDNQIAKGLKLDILGTLAPEKEKGRRETAIVNAIYKQSGFHTRAALDVFKVRAACSTTVFGPFIHE